VLGLLAEGLPGGAVLHPLRLPLMLIALSGGPIDYRNFVRNRFLRIFRCSSWSSSSPSRSGATTSRGTSRCTCSSRTWARRRRRTASSRAQLDDLVEFTFYLVFPFLGGFTLERGCRLPAAIAAAAAADQAGGLPGQPRSTHMFNPRWWDASTSFSSACCGPALPPGTWLAEGTRASCCRCRCSCSAQQRAASPVRELLPAAAQAAVLDLVARAGGDGLGLSHRRLSASSFAGPAGGTTAAERGRNQLLLLPPARMVIYIVHTVLGPITVTGRVWWMACSMPP